MTDGEETVCCVCQCDMTREDSSVVSLECGHLFHGKCIVPWLQGTSTSCPLCRHDPSHSRRMEGSASDTEWVEEVEERNMDLIRSAHARMGTTILRRKRMGDICKGMEEDARRKGKEVRKRREEYRLFLSDKEKERIVRKGTRLKEKIHKARREEREIMEAVRERKANLGLEEEAGFSVRSGQRMTWSEVCRHALSNQGGATIVDHPLLRAPAFFEDLSLYLPILS